MYAIRSYYVARKMLEEGMTLDVILRITGLSKKDLKDHGML
ncbi:hypothetical protein LEP1GSC021_1371 [Leptospira noguchii str. 1993005606]|nr:hypothetical protein [Leptospira noguchii]EPE84467.1 hypothetical protein LEP1GSC021_1371 [Leptospira noguchii str. 1993005606]